VAAAVVALSATVAAVSVAADVTADLLPIACPPSRARDRAGHLRAHDRRSTTEPRRVDDDTNLGILAAIRHRGPNVRW
jgi:hypothetical protein